MKMMKRFTSIILVLCMVLSLVPAVTLGASAADGTYTLVTSASDLAVGDKIVIAAKEFDVALSTNQKNDNRGAATVTKSDNTLTIGADVQILTLEKGTVDETYAFNTGSGYLYAPGNVTSAGKNQNYLKTKDSVDAQGSWRISISSDGTASVVAQGTNTSCTMQYNNSGNSNLFSCYTSASQQAIAIYKLTASSGSTDPEPSCDHSNTTFEGVVAATCIATGYSGDEVCVDCGETVTPGAVIDKIAHNYVSGTCSMCGAADPSADTNDYSGRYYIATIRTGGNYFYMTSNMSDSRYQAVDSGLTTLPSTIAEEDVVSNQVFVLEKNTDGTYMIYAEGISGDDKYLGWNSDNTGILVASDSAINATVELTSEGIYNIHFAASDAERYLSLNNSSSNNYFAWYKGTQKQNLSLIPVNGDGSGESGGEEGGDTSTDTVASIKIITGNGTAWFLDSTNNPCQLVDDKGNDLGTEASDKATVYRHYLSPGETLTLVLKPAADQRLASVEQGSDRLKMTSLEYDSENGCYRYTFVTAEKSNSVNNYFRITFLPRLSDGGYTAVQASENAENDPITAGIYVMTGVVTPETYTSNNHSVESTYLFYADEFTAVDEGYIAVGRKSSALQLSSVGVALSGDSPYLMTAVNKNHLVNIQPSGGHYTIGLVGAEGYYLQAITSNDLKATSDLTEAGTLWDINYLSSGGYQIVNVDTGRTLLFNSDTANLQFRAYDLSDPNSKMSLAKHAPVLYRATKVSQLVTYTVFSGTDSGSIYAYNNSAASAVASGTYQAIHSELIFTFTPAFGYQLDSVTVNGETVTLTDGTYTCTVVEGTDIHVEASYSEISADRKITVNYYVNGENALSYDLENVSFIYTLDIENLPAVTVNGKSYEFKELSFIRTVNGTAVYTDLQAAILVEDGDEINVYFSTTEVTLNKTVTETTDKNTNVNDKNGGLNSENFTDSNAKDNHGNVKQTFEVELNAQSFSHADDEIKGNTDVIVVLDNSNSMHFRDSNNSVYLNTDGYLAVRDSIGTGLDIISEVNSSSIWTISISSYAATITCQGGYTNSTLAYDSANNVFSVYPSSNSMDKVMLYRVNTDNELEPVYAVGDLQDDDTVFICDYYGISDGYLVNTCYMDASTQNRDFAHTAFAESDGYYLAKAFTIKKVDGGYTFHSANTKVYGATNSEYTMDALIGFYERVFAAEGNRVGIVKFNSSGYVWNQSTEEYVEYNGSPFTKDYSGISYENCFIELESDAVEASYKAIGTMEVDDGGTNFVGAWLMTHVLALTRDTADKERNLVIVFFTDGQPTVSYEFTGDLSTGNLWWSEDNSDMHPIAASGSNVAGGLYTSAGEYYFAMELAQFVKSTIVNNYSTGVSIHNVALLNDATLDVELVNRFMSDDESVAKQWYYYYTTAGAEMGNDPLEKIVEQVFIYTYEYYKYGNVSNETYKGDAYWLPVSTLYGDSYADSYTPVTGDVSNSLNAAFDSIAVTITPGKVVEGTIVDTIPADFILTKESKDNLEDTGWTVTKNPDGTTTITKPNVHADIDGETFTYEIQYLGNGYGAEYTNVEAKYIYEGVHDNEKYESYFPMPVVNVIPWTVNDGYTAETNVAVTLDVLKNDLFEELTAGGYTLSNFTVTLTDINGTPTTYFNAQAGGFDAVVDPASNTVSFMTEKGGNHVFYYVVSAVVTAPDKITKTTVYSRATRVDVLSVSAENVSDLDVLMAGESGTIPLLHNDKLTSGTGTNSNSVTLTDSNGDPLDLTQLSAISNVSVDSATGELTYTAVHSGVEQFWYVNQITASDGSGNTITVPTHPTKVTILVLENTAIVVDYGYTTQSLQAHPDLGSYTVDDGVTLDSVVKVSYPDAAGTYGTAAFQNGTFTFTPATTMYNGVDVFTYSVEVLENNYSVTTANHQPTVTVVPANSIYYEESFLNYATSDEGNNLVDWSIVGTVAERYQSTDNVLYGNDTAYSAYTEGYSGGSGKLATVTEEHHTAVAYFTFSGTGFDIYGLSSQDTGFLLAEVYAYNSDNAHGLGKLQKYVMVDTYIQGKTYEQLPILCCRNLAYGEYAVKIRVVYEKAFDHNLTATRNESIRNEDFYRQLLGLQAGIPMELSLSESASPATRSVPPAVSGSYSIVIDGLRIYQPLNATPGNAVASELYQEANELGLSFYRIRDLLLSADQWADKADGNGNVNGLVYIAADLPYTNDDTHYSGVGTLAPVPGADDTTDSGEGNDAAADETVYEGVYLTPTQTLKVDENGALIAPDGKNATIKVGDTDYVIYVKVVKDNNGKRYSYYYKDGDTKVTITPEQIEALGLMHIANYYAAIGPKYELYLTNGNGIAFNVIAGQLLHLSAKVPVGESANLLAYVGGEWKTVATVKSRTELYFDLTNFVNEDGSVVLKCEAPEGTVLSLCNIKTASLPTVSQQDTRKAVCIINGKEIEEENEFRMNHSISFNSDLRMNYRIKYSELGKLASNYVAEGAYLVVEKDVYLTNGSKTVETVTLTADLSSDPDRMIFYLDGITSVEMGSELRATLHFFDAEGKEHVSPVDTYSVLDYAKNCFKNYTDPQLYTMLIDLLNYGAAAQLYFGRNTAAPVNAGLDAYQKYSSTSLSAELNDQKTIIDNSNTVTAITSMNFSVNFDERTVLNVKMTLAEGYSYENISCVKVLDENGNELANIREFDILSDGRLQFSYEGITSTMMRQMCYFVAYVGDQMASQCVGYSIEAYVGKHMDFTNIKVSELMMRCIYYGDSAEAFFKN